MVELQTMLKGAKTATPEQLQSYNTYSAKLGARLINAFCTGPTLVLDYKTKAGFYVRCVIDKAGRLDCRQYFHEYNYSTLNPQKPVCYE